MVTIEFTAERPLRPLTRAVAGGGSKADGHAFERTGREAEPAVVDSVLQNFTAKGSKVMEGGGVQAGVFL